MILSGLSSSIMVLHGIGCPSRPFVLLHGPQWYFMVISGPFMAFHVLSLPFMVLCDLLWSFVSHSVPWLSLVVLHGVSWSIAVGGLWWFLVVCVMVFLGLFWTFLVLRHYIWFFLVVYDLLCLHGPSWSFMVLVGPCWPWVVLCGPSRSLVKLHGASCFLVDLHSHLCILVFLGFKGCVVFQNLHPLLAFVVSNGFLGPIVCFFVVFCFVALCGGHLCSDWTARQEFF